MGNSQFLMIIKDHKVSVDQSLLNCSSSKLREYYSSYKSICESFSITINQFIQIFGHNQKSFQIFDQKRKGRIDAIQMFTGLIIFSSINYQQKIKFLFQIFDFNQDGWLSFQAITFLIINVCNSTYKIFSLSKVVNSKEIQAFLSEYFYDQTQIKLEKFIKWSRRIEEFMTYFNIIQHDFQPYYQIKKINKFHPDIARQKCIKYKRKKNIIDASQQVQQLNQLFLDTKQKPNKKKFFNQQSHQYPKNKHQNLLQQIDTPPLFSNKQISNKPSIIKPNHKTATNKLLNTHSKINTQTNQIPNSQLIKQQNENVKTLKSKYRINFQFDNKFIEILEYLITPYEDSKGNIRRLEREREYQNQFIRSEKQGSFGNRSDQFDEYEDQDKENQFDNIDSDQQLSDQIFNPSLKWLYGINLNIQAPLKYLQTQQTKASNQIFLYSLNNIIILFYPKINSQKFYLYHKKHISCFQISQNSKLIASSDFNQDFEKDFPQIHIWSIKQRKPIIKFKDVQKGKIHKLKWINKDTNLLSISYYNEKWAIVLFNIMNGNILLSTYIKDPEIGIQRKMLKQNKIKMQGKSDEFQPFVGVIQCNNKNEQMKQNSYFLIYTHHSVTFLYPNQNKSINQGKNDKVLLSSSLSNNNDKLLLFSMINKILYNPQASKANNLLGKNSLGGFSKLNQELYKKRNFSPIICLISLNNNQFIAAHNDKKIRIWKNNFEESQIIWSRDQNQKSFIKILLFNQKNEQDDTKDNQRQNRLARNTSNKKQRRQSSLNKNKYPLAYGNENKTFQKDMFLFILDEQKVEILNIKSKKSEIIQIPQNLYNLMFISMELIYTNKNQHQIILVSLFGDVIRIPGIQSIIQKLRSQNQKPDHHQSKLKSSAPKKYQNQHQFTHSKLSKKDSKDLAGISYKKYYQIFYIQKCKDYYNYDQYSLILADRFIYKINNDQKQLSMLISFNNQLKSISGFSNYYAILTEDDSKYIYILYCDQIVEKIKLVHNVTAFKLIPTHLILCTEKYIQIYAKSYEKYLNQQTKKISLEGSSPIDICSTQNPYKFHVITQERQIFVLEIKNNDYKYKKLKSKALVQTYDSSNTSNHITQTYLQSMYPHQNSNYSFIFYPQQKFICLGLSNGQIRVWNNTKRIKNNKEVDHEFYHLVNHQGPVSKMRLRFYQEELELITMGQKDGMVAVYHHTDYLIGDKQKELVNRNNNLVQQQSLSNEYLNQIMLHQKGLTNNLNSSSPNNFDAFRYSLNLLKDSQISISIFDEFSVSWIQKIITKIIHPQTTNYQPLVGDNQEVKTNFINLQIQHVYGFSSQQVRNSAAYVHHYCTTLEDNFNKIHSVSQASKHKYFDQPLSSQKNNIQVIQTPSVNKKLHFANSGLMPLNQEHQNCKNQIIYFIDRLIVLYNPQTKSQRIYNFHRNPVTTFQVHPNKKWICSAQKSISFPLIHFWDTQTLVLLTSIKTKHKSGSIFKIQFSRQGTLVITLSGYCSQSRVSNYVPKHSQKNQMSLNNSNSNISPNTVSNIHHFSGSSSQQIDYVSIQIVQWKYSNSILYRVLLKQEIITVKFNPYVQNQICLGGRDQLKIYCFEGNNLILKQNLQDFNQTITSLVYSSAMYGTDIQSDIIVGTMSGSVLLYICGKLIKLKKIHDGSINFISINELFKYKTILITGAEDCMVKIWDMKFNLLSSLDIVQQLLINKPLNQFKKYNFSPQSIDFYSCYPQKKTQTMNQYVFLIGTRSGYILESRITSQYHGRKGTQDKKGQNAKQKLFLQSKVLLNSNNFTNDQTNFQLVGRKMMITYSMNSNIIFLWNSLKNELINFYILKGHPSVIKFDTLTKKIFIGYYKLSQIEIYKISHEELTLVDQIALQNLFYPDDIVFSPLNNYIAISINSISNYIPQGTFGPNATGAGLIQIVQIKQLKDSSKLQSVPKKTVYQMKFRLQHTRKKLGNNPAGLLNIVPVWMQFSSSGQQLLVLYSQKRLYSNKTKLTDKMISISDKFSTKQNINSYQILVTPQHAQKISKNSDYVMFSMMQKKQKEYSHEQFSQLNFYPFIRSNYIYYQKSRSSSLNGNQTFNNILTQADLLHPLICQMAQYQKFLVLGTTYGEVIFIHSDFFCSIHSKILQSKLNCKYYKLFSTPITKIQVNQDKIYISSTTNIITVKVHFKDDTCGYLDFIKDQYNEKTNQEYLQKYIKDIFPKRKYIYESRLNFLEDSQKQNTNNQNYYGFNLQNTQGLNMNQRGDSQQTKKRVNLQLYSAIGRNSLYKRNNIFVDLKDNIISHTGCNLIILKKRITQQTQTQKTKKNSDQGKVVYNSNITKLNNQQKLKAIKQKYLYTQQFLKLDISPFSTYAQLSCISISQDKRIIYAGTNEQNAKILIWDISTKTNLRQIYLLKNIISIKKLAISSENKYLAVIALNNKGENILFFVSIVEQNILAAYEFIGINQQEINDVKFLPGQEYSFLMCGNNYMAEWKYDGILSFQHYNIENPSDFIQIDKNTIANQNNKKSELEVIFYSLSFLKNILISTGSDGYLYIWNNKKIIKKQNAHPKSPILCIYASNNSKIFASGGVDGKAIIWQLTSGSIIQKVHQYSIYHGRDLKIPVRYHIQSVCISKNNLIVGTRAGQIYQFQYNQLQVLQKLKQQWKKGVNLILPAYDDDMINSISFNTSSEKLFLITQTGSFSVFDIETLQKVKQQRIDIGKSQIIKMIACKISFRIFIILKNAVLTYYYIYNKQQKMQKFRKGKQIFKFQQALYIKNAIMSSNQKYMALLVGSAQMDLYSIQLYDLTQLDNNNNFKQYKILDHIPTNVEIIDFSTDNQYLICKNTEDQQTIIQLSTHQVINENMIEFQLEYCDEAKKTSKNIRDVLQLYGEDNRLMKIAQIMNHSIIATDQMGSVRLFQYPIKESKNGQGVGYYRFYVEHLNQIYLCVLSQDCRLLATVGREDRTLLLWKIKQEQEQA